VPKQCTESADRAERYGGEHVPEKMDNNFNNGVMSLDHQERFGSHDNMDTSTKEDKTGMDR